MAAGRYGNYRGNGFMDRASDSNHSRRDFAFSNEDYGHVTNGHVNGRGRSCDLRDRNRGRQRDVREREVVDVGYRSSSSRSDSADVGPAGHAAPKWRRPPAEQVDKEPGELSSDSGSDGAVESEVQIKESETKEVAENGTNSPVEKKRKFSPIVWDRDDEKADALSRSKKSLAARALPPQVPPPKSDHQSSNPAAGYRSSVSLAKKTKIDHHSPVKSPVASEPSILSEVDTASLSFPPKEEEAEQRHEEDYVISRDISSSRWAAADNSPADEGEIVEHEEVNKRRSKTSVESMHSLRRKSQTPELGELKRESSEGARGRSSESDECVGQSRSPDNNAEKGDYMELDEQQDRYDSQFDSDSEDEKDKNGTPESAGLPLRSISMLQGCRSVDEFERLNKIDEGTYGVVYRARDKKSGEIVALKKVKMEKEREGFPLTSLREINILLSFHHPSIVDVKEVVVGSSLDSIFMVMEYMEHDLKGLMETMKQPFSQSEVKCLMLQLLEGVKYLHDNWVLHRDLKTSNLLLNNRGELKICDFGLARQYGSPLKPYTHLVVTLWYRAPELLLGAKQYSTAIDMWSLGCIMAELLSKAPLFNGKTELDQLDKIFRTLGTPNETIWPGLSKLPGVKVNFVKHQYNLLRRKFPATSFSGSPVLSDAGFDLLNKLLTYDPERRITAEAALKHDWFREVPLPKSKDFMPTFPAQHAQDRRLQRLLKSPDPLQELKRKELQQKEFGTGGVFG